MGENIPFVGRNVLKSIPFVFFSAPHTCMLLECLTGLLCFQILWLSAYLCGTGNVGGTSLMWTASHMSHGITSADSHMSHGITSADSHTSPGTTSVDTHISCCTISLVITFVIWFSVTGR